MKFTIFTQAILAVPVLSTALAPPVIDTSEVKRENCQLTLQWKSNWNESGLKRYRVQLITSPRNDKHLDLYCSQFSKNKAQLNNVACFWIDGMYVIDSSHAVGPAGYAAYKREHGYASKAFTTGTGCTVIQNL
ncbi:hypothetical protein DL771_002186 [Monosporascus sp. 5C6A]|nr:hypothetical protein DL771_002186 [Monosporascus sp. 5C6A]